MPRTAKATALTAVAVALVLATGAAAAPPISDGGVQTADGARDAHQHGDQAGHLNPEGTSAGVELVSKLKLKNAVPEKIADVGVFNGYAYLAAWGVVTCKYNGVHVVDIRKPAQPREVAFIASKEGSYPGEGVQALHIETIAFRGDILVTNNEKCKEPAGFGGMNIYDITRPTAPTPLTEGFGDASVPGGGKKAANEIHSVFAWDAGDRAYAVMVDNEEADDLRAIEDDRAHADEHFIRNGAGVEDRLVADGDQFADERGKIVRKVNHGAVLHIRARADDDAIDVAAQHGAVPHARLLLERDVADHTRRWRDPGSRVNRWWTLEETVELGGEIHERCWRGICREATAKADDHSVSTRQHLRDKIELTWISAADNTRRQSRWTTPASLTKPKEHINS